MWVRIGPCQTENRKLESFKGSRDIDGNEENIENEEKMEENFLCWSQMKHRLKPIKEVIV